MPNKLSFFIKLFYCLQFAKFGSVRIKRIFPCMNLADAELSCYELSDFTVFKNHQICFKFVFIFVRKLGQDKLWLWTKNWHS